MKAVMLGLAMLVMTGCSTFGFGDPPREINSTLDHVECLFTIDSDKNNYFEEQDIDVLIQLMSANPVKYQAEIAHATEMKSPMRTAREKCRYKNHMREMLHQGYVVSGTYR